MNLNYQIIIISFTLLLSIKSDLSRERVDLYSLYEEVYKKSKTLQKDKLDNITINSFFNDFFESDSNLLNEALGTADLGNCGILYLKKPCYLLTYKFEQEVYDDSIGCLNIYARHLTHPEKYLLQDFILFEKISGNWLILGSRTAIIELQDYAFEHLRLNRDIKDMFPNHCKEINSKEKLKVFKKLKGV